MHYDQDNDQLILFGGGGPNKQRFNTINLLIQEDGISLFSITACTAAEPSSWADAGDAHNSVVTPSVAAATDFLIMTGSFLGLRRKLGTRVFRSVFGVLPVRCQLLTDI